jgi:hypothetical protein
MKRLISELPIGPYRVALWETDEPLENGTASALWIHSELSIVLDSSLSGADRWAVLLHELVHCISSLYDLEIDKEHVCTSLGNGLTQMLKQWLPSPPRAIPPVPAPLDDDKTPSVVIVPITSKEQMP